uniref:Uncharacterized protein n=1 Tax=Arundo donax TaxID=35708 RepID=A0A0A9HYN8_ARUDO
MILAMPFHIKMPFYSNTYPIN